MLHFLLSPLLRCVDADVVRLPFFIVVIGGSEVARRPLRLRDCARFAAKTPRKPNMLMTTTMESTASSNSSTTQPLHVAVIVMGDVGRSPRMQYHAESLLQEGFTVSLIGYQGEQLIPSLQDHDSDRLHVIRFSTFSPTFLKACLPLYFLWRLCSLVGGLVWALWMATPSRPPVDCLLVQNPPAIPLLAISYLYCQFQRIYKRHYTAFVIDWHNLGYSMLNPGLFQRIAKKLEQLMAPLANGHLCVTQAMKEYLKADMNVTENISVLYDCPPSMFRPLSLDERHDFVRQIHNELCAACPQSWYHHLDPSRQTLFTEETKSGTIGLKRGRPALVTSSTSWTADEDFGILLEALVLLDKRLVNQDSDLNILVAVTGKGPMKSMYEEQISKLQLHHVAIQTLWLEPADYPKLLACADVGVSLHTSTSGLDLPMKVLDLFGCHVPVLALDFDCLLELVQDQVNGRVFDTSEQLSHQMEELLTPISNSESSTSEPLKELSKSLQDRMRWSENWKQNALPVIRHAVENIER